MSIIGEAILTVSIEMLFKKLATKGLQLFARHEQIQDDLKKWERMLVKIKAVLDDADEKQTTKLVRIWLGDLQNLAYDVEDILDEFATEAFRRELLNEPDDQQASASSSTSKLRKLIPTCCNKFSPRSVKFDSMMASKVKEITLRLQEIVKQKEDLGLKEISGGRSKRGRKQPETTSLVIEDEVHGREKDKDAIVELLRKDDSKLSVIPITGMGGLGKTTLAQIVYNDEKVISHFDLKAWACVSEDFDAVTITRTILKQMTGAATDDDLNSLQVKLKNELTGNKFLVVLDDMWNEIPGDWTNLRLPFIMGATAAGSKIIVTTRNIGVAKIMGTVPAYKLEILSNDDCLFVFAQQSLGTKDFSEHPHLKEIGEEIVKKCNGLPLAAKALGGLLRGEDDPHDWERVLKNKIWEEEEEEEGSVIKGGGGGEIMRALRVSYYYLPACLKRCFTHCALLPKDYEFREEEIVLLWMAEGLLQSNRSGDKEMEEFGHYYFQELRSKSFFQQSKTDESLFVMHDLINDLAQWAAKEMYYYRMEDKPQEFPKTLRHFSYICSRFDSIKKFQALDNAKNLRTFLPMIAGDSYLSYDVIHLLLKLQRLRALSLRGYIIYEIPNVICDLKHLWHLDLSLTRITTLPESINRLYNLHTLLLENCPLLKKLCSDMGNLIKLCHLNNSDSISLEEMPLGIGKLTCLKTLSHFVIGENSGSRLQELKSLKNLRGKLKISRLENVKDAEAKEVELNGKQNLDALSLEWSTSSDGNILREAETETRVLDVLRPHEHLKEFCVQGYGGTKFPIWFGNSKLANLVRFEFKQCGKCTCLPLLGQLPILKHLFVSGMSAVKSVGPEFYGSSGSMAFPLLETLRFEQMEEWEDWIPHGHGCGEEREVFPRLRELYLSQCPKLLGRLPERLLSLEKLFIQNCEQLVVAVPFTPTLCTFEIKGCKKVEWRSATDLSSSNSLVSNVMFSKLFLRGVYQQHQLLKIEELEICKTEELTYLWQTRSELLQDMSSLQSFKISSCPGLVSLVAEDDEEVLRQQKGLPCSRSLEKLPQELLSLCSLKVMWISDCHSLKSLPQALIHNGGVTPLESLHIYHCDSLTYIANVQPAWIKRLEVRQCRNLTTLICEGQDVDGGGSRYTSVLEHLYVEGCPSLTSLWSKSEIPATLESIEVWDCQNFKVLPDDLHKADNLQQLKIAYCPNLVCFPEGGLPCKRLTYLTISGCDKLKALPNLTCIHNLTSLQYLDIKGFPSIESVPAPRDDDGFGFPSNLVELEIDYNEIFKPLLEWVLHSSSCIRKITLFGRGCSCSDEVSSDDALELMLPTSLKRLWIAGFPNLECLSSNIGKLSSLEFLCLLDCPKLQYFPERGLPASLLQLWIYGCPLIKDKCKKDKGQYWHLIAHLPRLKFDGVSPFDPSAETQVNPV